MTNCEQATKWGSRYQKAGSLLVKLHLFDTFIGTKILDYLDGKVCFYCNDQCKETCIT